MPLKLDPSLFELESVSSETAAFNAEIIEMMREAPDMWSMPPEMVRSVRAEGGGPFPIEPEEPGARNFDFEVEGHLIPVRIFSPKNGLSKGTYLHIHGGGWMLGSYLGQEVRLQEIADNCSLSCVSVEYRLAPEHPYPAGPDDCEHAALWLLENDQGLNTDFLAIGGESAGAHLASITLLRLRNRFGKCPFHAAALTAGVYDLGQTASARNWGSKKLILNSRDMRMFSTNYLHGGEDMRDPDISPLYASLEGMPPVLFSTGTADLLLDDSLLMATRWHAANGNAELDVTPGGCHVFQSFRQLEVAKSSNANIDRFLNSVISGN